MRILIAILSMLAIAGCSMESFDFKKTVTIEESSFGEAKTVDIDIAAGSIRVDETDTDVVLVEYEARLGARDEATLAKIASGVNLIGERTGATLTIRAPELRKEERRRGQREYHVVLKVPAKTNLRARCLVGSIVAKGLAAPHLEGATGRVRLVDGSGAATLISQTGRVSVKNHSGTATCTTTTGPIDASFQAVEGQGEMAFTTSVGSIKIEIPEDTSATFDAQTSAGSIEIPTILRSDDSSVKGVIGKTFAGAMNGGEHTITLRARTGTITIETR